MVHSQARTMECIVQHAESSRRGGLSTQTSTAARRDTRILSLSLVASTSPSGDLTALVSSALSHRLVSPWVAFAAGQEFVSYCTSVLQQSVDDVVYGSGAAGGVRSVSSEGE